MKCPAGFYIDDNACMCMLGMKCRKGCPRGMKLDPREACNCVDDDVVKALSMCEPEDMISLPVEEPEVSVCYFPEEEDFVIEEPETCFTINGWCGTQSP